MPFSGNRPIIDVVLFASGGYSLPVSSSTIIPSSSQGILIFGKDITSGSALPLATDLNGFLVTIDYENAISQQSGSLTGFVDGNVTTATATQTVVRSTIYNEQTGSAQRSLISNNTNDTSFGTGARTVKITYYDNNVSGPYTEVITMNGIIAVDTIATDICFIEKMEVLTVGSNNSNVGTITIKTGTGGTGSDIGTIAASAGQTFWAHHYVRSNKTFNLRSITAGCKGTKPSSLIGKFIDITQTNQFEKQVTSTIRVGPETVPSIIYDGGIPIKITGPGRFTMYNTSDGTSTCIYYVSFFYYEV